MSKENLLIWTTTDRKLFLQILHWMAKEIHWRTTLACNRKACEKGQSSTYSWSAASKFSTKICWRFSTKICRRATRLINTKRYQDSSRQASLLQRLEFSYFSTDSNYLPATIMLLCQNCRHVCVSWPWELLLLFLLLNTVCETHLYVR